MPFDRSKYPPNWEDFSRYIRFERAGGACEWCGARHGAPHHVTGALVVLTVAHLDARGGVCDCEQRTGKKCANKGHVRALCQQCHNSYYAEKRKNNRRRTRARRHGQRWLGDMERA